MEARPPCPWTGGLNLDLIPLFSCLSSLWWMMSSMRSFSHAITSRGDLRNNFQISLGDEKNPITLLVQLRHTLIISQILYSAVNIHLSAQEMLQTTFVEGNTYKWYVSVFSITPLSHSSHIYNLNFRSREAFLCL